MKHALSTLALVCALGFGGAALAEDAMSTPMANDAMAGDAMATDAPMSADEMLAACLVKAEAEMDAMKKDEATKKCHDAHNMAGDAIGATKL